MSLSLFSFVLTTYVIALMGIAFFTLLERKALGYFHIRKGPNKVGLIGLPQPLADAIKLFTKELSQPSLANINLFVGSPLTSLLLALFLWSIYPSYHPSYFILFGVLFFICISSLNVYTTLIGGWSSNSKYALLGAIRGIAQTISYEVSMSLILLSALIILKSINILNIYTNSITPLFLLILPIFLVWFTTILAETNRTPFDFAEGESELVSGFNTEYRGGTFAFIFIAEYLNIILIRLLTAIIFFSSPDSYFISILILRLKTLYLSFAFVWARATLPRLRYDLLINITWKCFLPLSLGILIFIIPFSYIIWYRARMNG